MRKLLIALLFLFFGSTINTFGQFDLGEKILNKTKKKIEKKVDREVDKTIDKGLEGSTEKEENSKAEKTGNDTADTKNENSKTVNNSATSISTETTEQKINLWSKYDFVPGDKVIFEDNLMNEESGEFPSRWDLLSGSAEVASLNGETVIHLTHDESVIKPLMREENFLPEVFTLEFDLFFEKASAVRSHIYNIRLFEGSGKYKVVDGKSTYPLNITWNSAKLGDFGGEIQNYVLDKKDWQPTWKHIAIAFNKRSFKLYMDEERVLNIPRLKFEPKTFSIGVDFDARYIKFSAVKNIRLNEGGKKLYDGIVADGKFITRGILFDVNKSTIKAESMGVLNEIVKLMNEHEDLNFRIEGHTDSDGDNDYNQKLSDERAASVKTMLINLGINSSRLDSKGLGENSPIDSNTNPEGKANNRRVEFIKI